MIPTVLNSMMIHIKDNKNNEINLITNIFDIHIKIMQIHAELTLDLSYDLSKKNVYSLVIAATNDYNCHKACSPGSLGYWIFRIRFENVQLINTNPLTFMGNPLNIQRRTDIPM